MASMKSCLLITVFLAYGPAFGQKYKVLYAQFDSPFDTSRYDPSPFRPNPDTLAKWIFQYDNGIAIIKQTEDSEYEKKFSLLNKRTSNFDNITSYNMSRNDVYYNDYIRRQTYSITHFFDVKYVIEDVLPKFQWTIYEETSTILGYQCKHASGRYPLDKYLMFDVWYTEDIPITGGPMELNGLKGLVLRVDRNMQPFYTVIFVKQLVENDALVIEKPTSEQKAITFSEYQKMRFGVPFENHDKQPPIKKNN